jgi:hypothetical protein
MAVAAIFMPQLASASLRRSWGAEENVWLDDVDDDFVDDARARARRAGEPRRGQPRPDLLRWYIVASQGGSLHRQAAHPSPSSSAIDSPASGVVRRSANSEFSTKKRAHLRRTGPQKPDHRHRRLLRTHRERPGCRCAAE